VLPDCTEDTAIVLASSLIDKSLLSIQIGPTHTSRIMMLEPIRDFARERLAERGDDRMMHERHAEWCLTLAEQSSIPEDRGRGSPHLRTALEGEIDNLRVARDWAAATRHDELLAQLCDALGEFWHTSGRIREGYEWFLRIHQTRADGFLSPDRQMRLALRTAITARHVGDLDIAAETYARARDLAEGLDQPALVVAATTGLGLIAEMRGDEATALTCFRQALLQQRHLGDPRGLIMPLVNLGDAEYRTGDLPASQRHSEEARRLADTLGERLMGSLVRGNLGQLALAASDPDAAWGFYHDGLAIARETQDGFLIADAVGGMVGVAIARDAVHLAGRLLGATQGLCERFGGAHIPHFGHLKHARNVLASLLSPDELDHLVAEGTTWPLDDVLRGISSIAPDQSSSAPLPRRSVLQDSIARTNVSLTKREVEVLHLVAQGYSDRDIAEMLSLSPRTVSGHVGTACKKFQVRTRLEATVRAQRMGLISTIAEERASGCDADA
ncbi:MAG: LuxR C-terminal-related transcriptional regulator, partial [Thermomicrobiales bacterium]